jgi:GntR family transcriptional regulator, transcriptional repressor for pyruvate dehydrogenase complex
VTRPQSLAPMLSPQAGPGAVRAPKTAELVAGTLRRMIVDGQLTDGDFLPHETELMAHFKVSRPTLREAVRVLESERLVEVRRGSRTGARVCVPSAEIVARPAALLLELSGATLADVMTARIAFEPPAARLLAESGTDDAHVELARLVEEIPQAWETGELATATANLHRRMVELSGNATLGIIAGMLYEITVRHTSTAIGRAQKVPKPEYTRLLKSYGHLVELVTARNGAGAEEHWRVHMEAAAAALLKGYEKTKVLDIMN